MALPKSLYQPIRRGQLVVGGAWRAFFAPFNTSLSVTQTNSALGPNILDLNVQGPFNDQSLPSNWYDLGWINGFKITPGSKIGQVRSGYKGAVRAQYRGQVGETFECNFREMSRMALKLSTGSEVFNLMKNPGAVASTVGPLSSSGATAVPLGASGYIQSGAVVGYVGQPALYVATGSGSLFSAGDYIVADDDYTGQTGYVGSAGINVLTGQVSDIDFIRKTSDFVARVVAVVGDSLVLNAPFVGGGNSSGTSQYGPNTATAKVQKIKGYVCREGGSFIPEWSALLLVQTVDNSQIAIYYPHVSPNQFKDFAAWQLENAGTVDLMGYELQAVFEALAFDDPMDGETVVRYAAYYPTSGLSPQI